MRIDRIITLLLLVCVCGPVFGGKPGTKELSATIIASATGWTGATSERCSAGVGDFIRAGALGENMSPGTVTDEGAIVAIIADKIVANGGYFCPWQIQCVNWRKDTSSETNYYVPSGTSPANCVWLCKDGYSGLNCGEQTVVLDADGRTLDSIFGTPALQTGLEPRVGDLSANVQVFKKDWRNGFRGVHGRDGNNNNDWGEVDNLLGVVKVLSHGVMVAPVQVACEWQNWKDVTSFVGTVAACAGATLLCQEGYTPNADKTDCIVMTEDMLKTKGKTLCAGFDKEKFNSEEHVLDAASSTCVKYFCKETGMAFTSATDHTCAECSTGIKGGSNPKDGTCVKCSTGQYFDKTTGECKLAYAYSSLDLVYGKGKDRNTQKNLDNQCWTIFSPGAFKQCVESGGELVDEADDDADVTGRDVSGTMTSAIQKTTDALNRN